ncbi:MAG: peptidylprolyl isomerase [Thermoplasmata archaeon]|nr:peptidylprolyl isomerase [Thermoplasmata archaeon]RLF56431.1 MAG: peptidylprolyl isomerase [Thermoplasmata archaeon]RLF74244.1 MAG: peptidylprolyl isomerase [Thermoplasmata archaeon]
MLGGVGKGINIPPPIWERMREVKGLKWSILILVILLLPALIWAKAARDEGPSSPPAAAGERMVYVNTTVEVTTNYGSFTIMLYDQGAPITTDNFKMLVKRGFYIGTKFHRVIDDFVIQGGDPNSKDNNPYNDGWGGSEETIPLEINESLTHVDGAVGMARSQDPDSASSQFYICDGPQHQLDGSYAVFGVVIEGMDTVRRIASAETYGMRRPLLKDHPVDDIVILSMEMVEGHLAPSPHQA